MDSDSEEDEEQKKRLLESVDTNFISDDMFVANDNKKESNGTKKVSQDVLKSQRHPPPVENIFKSELNISEATKKYIWTQLSARIDNFVKFVDIPDNSPVLLDTKSDDIKSSGLRLLSDSWDRLQAVDIYNFDGEINRKNRPRSSPPPDVANCRMVAMDRDAIQNETKNWAERSKSNVNRYKEKNNKLYLLEPDTEFTKLRKKNNWCESKISSKSLKKTKKMQESKASNS